MTLSDRMDDVGGPPDDSDPRDGIVHLRTPPQSIEAEQSVLGGLLLDNAALAGVSGLISAADFFRHEHRAIFGAVCELCRDGGLADIITVYGLLQRTGQAETVGGLKYLNDLAQSVPSAAGILRYAEIVRDRAMLRGVLEAADRVSAAVYASGSVAQVLDEAKTQFGAVELRRGPDTRRVPLLDMAAMRESAASVRWLVKGALPADSLGMIYGASGTFKSFIALDAALHVVHGLPWMGRRTTQGPVVYIAAEGGAGLWKRIAAWHRQRRIQWQGAPFYVVPVAMDLQQDAWRVVEAVQALGVCPSMVVVDTLSQTYGGEENSANEMAAYFRELGARFRGLWRCAVMLVHHSGHSVTERPRGSSAIRANVDWLFGVFRDEQEMLATVSCQKQKDTEGFGDATFRMLPHELGVDEDGDKVSSLVARHLSSIEEVRDAMDNEGKAGRRGNNAVLLDLIDNGMQEADLRTLFYRECGADTAEARRQAYHRARTWAVKAGLIEVAHGTVITLKTGG